jgi:bifunctional N-acetylglucosamine-1-phosphate-uridyltransferase/glucosamine-1-phosphate-acetyltransferase GlmU-like protein
MATYGIILAGGMGTRMKSHFPKPCHLLKGKALIKWVLDAVQPVVDRTIIVCSDATETYLKETLKDTTQEVLWVLQQPRPMGTGHAVQCALKSILPLEGDQVVVLNADAPFIETSTIQGVLSHLKDHEASLLACNVKDPTGYGRIVYRGEKFSHIVEERDTTSEEKNIALVNAGVYAFDLESLQEVIFSLNTDNAQREYYLTDVFSSLKSVGVYSLPKDKEWQILNINTPQQLQSAETYLDLYL